MNREIKFRLWCVNKKEWESDAWGIGQEGDIFDLKRMMAMNTEKHILQQYTGLIDKNGKEIYEGDIVSPIEINRTIAMAEIKYYLAGFIAQHFTCERNSIDASYMGPFIEVVGNIFETPELIG